VQMAIGRGVFSNEAGLGSAPIADIVNGLMALPNLIGIIGLRKVIIQETEAFKKDFKEQKKIQA